MKSKFISPNINITTSSNTTITPFIFSHGLATNEYALHTFCLTPGFFLSGICSNLNIMGLDGLRISQHNFTGQIKIKSAANKKPMSTRMWVS